VIFEVLPHAEHRQAYLDTAADLRPHLEQIEGFVSVERFQSLSQPGKLLSLSFWRDESAVQQWRKLEPHRQAQTAGREHLFAGYRLRVTEVRRDYGLHERDQAPADSRQAYAKCVTLLEVSTAMSR
jgi:heme-degrading monooxygenase HmoA